MFRERETTHALARHESREPARMLLRRAEGMDCLYRERALNRCQRAQARVGAFELLHDEAVRRVTKARAAVLFQIWRVKTQSSHPRNEMFREFARAMARNDLRQDFLLHKTPRSIACCAFLLREKLFGAVIIQRGHARESLSHGRQFNDHTTPTQRSLSPRDREPAPLARAM